MRLPFFQKGENQMALFALGFPKLFLRRVSKSKEDGQVLLGG